eukprot:Platyproteum_vivax@DN12329_c0_g1_i1.p1
MKVIRIFSVILLGVTLCAVLSDGLLFGRSDILEVYSKENSKVYAVVRGLHTDFLSHIKTELEKAKEPSHCAIKKIFTPNKKAFLTSKLEMLKNELTPMKLSLRGAEKKKRYSARALSPRGSSRDQENESVKRQMEQKKKVEKLEEQISIYTSRLNALWQMSDEDTTLVYLDYTALDLSETLGAEKERNDPESPPRERKYFARAYTRGTLPPTGYDRDAEAQVATIKNLIATLLDAKDYLPEQLNVWEYPSELKSAQNVIVRVWLKPESTEYMADTLLERSVPETDGWIETQRKLMQMQNPNQEPDEEKLAKLRTERLDKIRNLTLEILESRNEWTSPMVIRFTRLTKDASSQLYRALRVTEMKTLIGSIIDQQLLSIAIPSSFRRVEVVRQKNNEHIVDQKNAWTVELDRLPKTLGVAGQTFSDVNLDSNHFQKFLGRVLMQAVNERAVNRDTLNDWKFQQSGDPETELLMTIFFREAAHAAY